MKWQPIETAPLDGTWVLLCGGTTTEEDVDRYEEGIKAKDTKRPVTAFWRGDEWCFAFWDGSWYSRYDRPTHWMPLPPPPEDA